MAIETTEIEANGWCFAVDLSTPSSPGDTPDSSPAGELVVMLHGFPHTRHTWRRELAALDEAGYRVVAFDQRGYSPGARPHDVSAYGTQHLLADVLGVADAVAARIPGADDPGFHVVGHDWGGQLAWLLAATCPDRVRSVAVISRPHPAAFALAMKSDPEQAGRSGHHRRHMSPDATDDWLREDAAPLKSALARMGVSDDDAAVYLETLGDRPALDAAINWYRAAGVSGLRAADTPSITVPALYVWGTDDATVGRIAAESTGQFIGTRYRFVEVPEGRHCITDQTPGLFTEHLLAHLACIT